MARQPAPVSARRATVQRTYKIPQALVSRARRILNVRIETEAIVRSLDEVVFRDEIERAVQSAGGKLPDFFKPTR
jgi:hypothetical protein